MHDHLTGVPAPAGTQFQVPPGASGVAAICQARAAYEAGEVVVASDGSVLDALLPGGQPPSSTDVEYAQDVGPLPVPFPDNWTPGPTITAGPSVPYNSPLYAEVNDPTSNVPAYFSTDAVDGPTSVAALNAWIASTVGSAAIRRKPLDAIGQPPSNAWANLGSATLDSGLISNNQPGGTPAWANCNIVGNCDQRVRNYGQLTGVTYVYRATANDPYYDYFLVDTSYSVSPYCCYGKTFSPRYMFWMNSSSVYYLNEDTQPTRPSLIVDVAPDTPIESQTMNFNIGASLGLKGSVTAGDKGFGGSGEGSATVNFGWSVSVSQPSVRSSVTSGVGTTKAGWQDVFDRYQNSANVVYRGRRVAIIRVDRSTIYNTSTPSITVRQELNAAWDSVQGLCGLAPQPGTAECWRVYGGVQSRKTFYLPAFDVQPRAAIVTRVGSTVTLNVRASAGGTAGYPVTWRIGQTSPSSSYVAFDTGIDPNAAPSGDMIVTLRVNPPPPNTQLPIRGTLFFNTVPNGASDSVRSGSIAIPYTIGP